MTLAAAEMLTTPCAKPAAGYYWLRTPGGDWQPVDVSNPPYEGVWYIGTEKVDAFHELPDGTTLIPLDPPILVSPSSESVQ